VDAEGSSRARGVRDLLPRAARGPALFLGVGVGYATGSLAAFGLLDALGSGPTFFPSAGLTLALLCLLDRRWWPVVLAAAAVAELVVNLAHGLGVAASLGFVLANTAEPSLGAVLIRSVVGRTVSLERRRSLAAFLVAGVLIGPGVGGIIGATTALLFRPGAPEWWQFVGRWWLGDGLAVLVVGSAIIAWAGGRRSGAAPPRWLPMLALIAVLAATTVVMFWWDALPLAYVIVLLLGGIAFQSGIRGVTAAGVIIAFAATESVAVGRGLWADLGVPAGTALIYLQLLLALLIATMMALAVEVHERDAALLQGSLAEAARQRAELAAAAERDAHQRAELLQDVADALTGAAGVSDVVEALHTRGFVPFGAAGTSAGVKIDETTVRVFSCGFPKDVRARYAVVPHDAQLPGPAVLRTGQPLFFPSDVEAHTRFPDVAPILVRTGYSAAAVLPMRDGQDVFGYLAAHFDDRREFSAPDRSLLETLAGQAAQSIQRAQLYEQQLELRQQAESREERQQLISEVSARLDRSPSPTQRMQVLVDALVPAMADFATVEIPTEQPTPELVAISHVNEAKEKYLKALRRRHALTADAPHGVARVLATGSSQLLETVDEARFAEFAVDAEAQALLLALAPCSYLAVPLAVEGAVIGALMLGFSDSGRHYRHEDLAFVEDIAGRAALAIENARLYERERSVALALQVSLLPRDIPTAPQVAIAVRYRAGEQDLHVGGDWYDVIELAGGRLGIAIGDVVGHGLAAAAAMGQLRSAASALVVAGLGPGELLTCLDQIAGRITGGKYSTAFCAEFDPVTGVFRYAAAGHPPPLLIGTDGAVSVLDGGRSPLLCVANSGRRPEAETAILPGSVLVLYTDGLIEQDRSIHGLDRLIEAAGRNVGIEPGALCDALLTAQLGHNPPRDDVALVCLQYHPHGDEREKSPRHGRFGPTLLRHRMQLPEQGGGQV
jgi:serine phosphatase RsbU (regulator of sigma subunit)/integral membrane sensor domain MASE1